MSEAGLCPRLTPRPPELDTPRFFVADSNGLVVGMSGYTRLDGGKGKARLLAVDPSWRHRGIGEQLHRLRMRALWDVGCKVIVSYTDRPPLAHWLCLRFGYEEVRREPKGSPGPKPAHPGPSGADAVLDEWIVLEGDLRPWRDQLQTMAGLRGGEIGRRWSPWVPLCAGQRYV